MRSLGVLGTFWVRVVVFLGKRLRVNIDAPQELRVVVGTRRPRSPRGTHGAGATRGTATVAVGQPDSEQHTNQQNDADKNPDPKHAQKSTQLRLVDFSS